jgi:hypothetical protein
MSTLILENVPEEIVNNLLRQAEEQKSSVTEAAIEAIKETLERRRCRVREATSPRLPDPPFLSEEISAPFDLPRPGPSFRVKASPGGQRLPEPLRDELELPQ